MPSKHAILSPSASKRWLTCTPSARLEAMCPDVESIYAQEGTLAHSTAEASLRELLAGGYAFVPELDDFTALPSYREDTASEFRRIAEECKELGVGFDEMLRTVYEGYVKLVYEDYLVAKAADPDARLIIEAELELQDYIPDGFGSSDAVIIYGNRLKVYDLKYGKGVKVDAHRNSQMSCYAIGAYFGPAETWSIDTVTMTIIQPRLSWVSSWEIPSEQLLRWGESILRPRALEAFEGIGPKVCGEHCKFCRCKAGCEVLRDFATRHKFGALTPADMTDGELQQALYDITTVMAWCEAVQSYAMEQALQGRKIPGFKLVEGRSIRRISNADAVVGVLNQAGFAPSDYYKPSELKAITDLEKLVGKKQFGTLLGEYVEKPQGKPTLVEESDRREEFKPSTCKDFDDL